MEYFEKVAAYEDAIMEKIALNKMEKMLSSVGQHAIKTNANPRNMSTISDESLDKLINTSMRLADVKKRHLNRMDSDFNRHPRLLSQNRRRPVGDSFTLHPLPEGYNTGRAHKPGVDLGNRHKALDEAIARNKARMSAPKDIRNWF